MWRVAAKHKVRIETIPTAYNGTTNLKDFVDIGGETFGIGMETTANVTWTFTRVGYEWDALSGDAGYLGVVASLNHSALSADVSAPTFNGTRTASYDRSANVPSLGATGQINLGKVASVGTDVAVVSLWRSTRRVHDVGVYVTANIVAHLAARIGYRSVSVNYAVTEQPSESAIIVDAGNLKMNAPYIGAILRF